jgi:hypothetical protein
MSKPQDRVHYDANNPTVSASVREWKVARVRLEHAVEMQNDSRGGQEPHSDHQHCLPKATAIAVHLQIHTIGLLQQQRF